MLEGLRIEIIEAEKARIDLLKWKLIVVAGLAGIGFGFFSAATGTKDGNTQDNEISHLALSVIPLACLYVDLLCYNLQVRMIVISLFIQSYRSSDGSNDGAGYCMYEKFCDTIRGAFKLEDWAMEYSTRFISGLIVLSTVLFIQQHHVSLRTWTSAGMYATFILFSGVLGMTLSRVIKRKYIKKIHKAQNTIHQNMKEACQTCNTDLSSNMLNPS
ncbi:hypothetical protein [Synechococcus sp. BA-132 BA5]|uniref:hypothetical protein n=1 Tax=Synechococcus sp. BA-132 BA5 TaxID=3110252 RepID=UPI002B20C2EF|nr:hypothetical protein [Synechococcus sp. BA-132 BA5]MEA5414507.1 hypothetical protein [Synechococcus sp. BA-132 BA5]